MAFMSTGIYQTACEASPHKQQIDIWLNEGKPVAWISRELKAQFGESISDKSVTKYKKYRQDFLMKEVEKTPEYQQAATMLQEHINDTTGKMKQIDAISELATIINDSAALLQTAKENNIQIRTIQDYRFVTQSMLDAIKLYGDTVLKAQRFAAVEENPDILKPTTINVNIKEALVGVLGNAVNNGGYDLIDQLRAGIAAGPQAEDKSDAGSEQNGDENIV